MFTGIVREKGRIAAVGNEAGAIRLTIEAPETARTTSVGDSVAINGCCLTAVAVTNGTVAFDAVPETLRRSSLAAVGPGGTVNLEPALRVGEPVGGHYVQGHVDGIGTVRSLDHDGDDVRLWIDAPQEILRLCIDKGSITVDGVALTITNLDERGFEVALVPHTLEVTTLRDLKPGGRVNLEADVLAKYVERLLAPR